MKKSFLFLACAMLSASIFAQTPQQPTSVSSEKSKKVAHAQVKKDHTKTKTAKAALTQDKNKVKSDVAKGVSSQTKKQDKRQLKADKATVKANRQAQKTDKKAVAKKAVKKPTTSTSSVSSTPKN